MLEIRREFPDLTVRCGIEAGLDIKTKDRMADMLAEFQCDFVIGSQHIVFGSDPFFQSSWEGRTQREMYDEYMRVSLETVNACEFFDVLGHITLAALKEIGFNMYARLTTASSDLFPYS